MHHPEKCMGCGYCTWRCPYQAPEINPALGYIEKCHFCAERTTLEIEPACVTACPTGALRITWADHFDDTLPAWFPDTGIKPSLILKGTDNQNKPLIIHGCDDEDGDDAGVGTDPGRELVPDAFSLLSEGRPQTRLKKDWSLALFSFLVISASAVIFLSALTGKVTNKMIPLLLLAGALTISLTHLGKPARAWRSLLNIGSSPLSREIAIVLLLAVASLLELLFPGLIPPVIQAVIAMAAVISVDLVYFAADRTVSLKLHSGQSFFTTIFAVSWFTQPQYIFLVFSMLAAVSVVLRYRSASAAGFERVLYNIRAITLPLVFILIYPEHAMTDILALFFFIAGLAADRLLFYYDFMPPDTRRTISEHFLTEYEKERNKQCKNAGLS
jgi:DMSO reductase anchor subunit/NAD-dependent dihydropyrimidine dehydrogenase PreA subunit